VEATPQIVVSDYGMGHLTSIAKGLERAGAAARPSDRPRVRPFRSRPWRATRSRRYSSSGEELGRRAAPLSDFMALVRKERAK
jgi:hypothetical protein